MFERVGEIDVALFVSIHRTLYPTAWRSVLLVVQYAGEGAGMAALFAIVLLLAPRGRRLELVSRILAPVLVASGLSELLKRVVNADRPRILVPDLVLNGEAPKHFSWPSGHTTAVFAFATAVLLLRLSGTLPARRWTAASAFAFAVAAITGFARIVVGAHFPGDVLSGAILGISASALTCRVVDLLYERYRAASRAQAPATV